MQNRIHCFYGKLDQNIKSKTFMPMLFRFEMATKIFKINLIE